MVAISRIITDIQKLTEKKNVAVIVHYLKKRERVRDREEKVFGQFNSHIANWFIRVKNLNL